MIAWKKPKKATGSMQLKKKRKGKKKKTTAAILRLTSDMEPKKMAKRWRDNLKFVDKGKMDKMILTLTPDEGLWKNQKILFEISIPKKYPYQPPHVKCLTRVWHPNIDDNVPGSKETNEKGGVCLNILRKDWTAVLDLNTVFLGLDLLFLEPNPHDPLNIKASNEYAKEYDKFLKKTKKYMKGNYSRW